MSKVTLEADCECCKPSSSSSLSSSSLSSLSESSEGICDCGYVVWYRNLPSGDWTETTLDSVCNFGACSNYPSAFVQTQEGCKQNCSKVKPDAAGAVDVSSQVLTCLTAYGGSCQYSDTEHKAICCAIFESSASSSSSSSSSSVVAAATCLCACDEMCGKDVCALIELSAPDTCTVADAEFTLKYKDGSAPTDNVELLGGISAQEWWRGTVTWCGESWKFVLYCESTETGSGCAGLRMYAEEFPVCSNLDTGTIDLPLHANSGCTCSPVNIGFGDFAGPSECACCASSAFSFHITITECS